MKEYINKQEFIFENGKRYSFSVFLAEEKDTWKENITNIYVDIFEIKSFTINLWLFKKTFNRHRLILEKKLVIGYQNTNITPNSILSYTTQKIKRELVELYREKDRYKEIFKQASENFTGTIGDVPPEFIRNKNINEILK